MSDDFSFSAWVRTGARSNPNYEGIAPAAALREATMHLSMVRSNAAHALVMAVGHGGPVGLAIDWARTFGSENIFSHRALSAANAPQARAENDDNRLVLVFGSAMGQGSLEGFRRLAALKKAGASFVSINPVRHGLASIADHWLPVRPGSDAALLAALSGANTGPETGLSHDQIDDLRALFNAHRGQTAFHLGRGVLARRDGHEVAALVEGFGEDILASADDVMAPAPIDGLLAENRSALLSVNSTLVENCQAGPEDNALKLDAFAGPVIAVWDGTGPRPCADLLFEGDTETVLLTLAAHLGLDGFADANGVSHFVGTGKTYEPEGVPPPRWPASAAHMTALVDDPEYPLHAISLKRRGDENRALVVMHRDAAAARGLEAKATVQIVSPLHTSQAVLATSTGVQRDTVYTFSKSLFAPHLASGPQNTDPTTGQPAWFDLKVDIRGR